MLTLVLVVLAVLTPVGQVVADLIKLHRPHPNFVLAAVLACMALAARFAPWWRRELEQMTRDRARNVSAAALILVVALSISGHAIASSLGLGDAYPLLGPASSTPGAYAVLIALTLAATALLFETPTAKLGRQMRSQSAELVSTLRDRRVVQATDVAAIPIEVLDLAAEEPSPSGPAEAVSDNGKSVEVTQPLSPPPSTRSESESQQPPIDLFTPPPKAVAAPPDLELKSQRIQDTLASFNVGARVVGYNCGPTVTQFDIQPEPGVKVRKITELQNDLALALAAPTIRIQAPVPGKSVVGIEIPNSSATMVSVRELLESDQYRGNTSALKVVLGKDVAGKAAVIDLAKMPHLLIAGATGSGKSVCVNALISCLLYQATPDEVRLLMVDPKMVELTVYNGVPHLLSPVVTEMDKVVGVLQWAIREMERRYQIFKDTGVRNIGRFNEKAEMFKLKKLPYIVLIVDELADLMMVAPEDVEDAICRLAQLARAAGIHLVIATQRPSVDVVTGLIKANFPARIAFAMTSQIDSRTILDTGGAEKLLGRGDMLYQPPDGPKPVRLQGAFLSDQEIEGLVEFWKNSPLNAVAPRVAETEFAEAEKAGRDMTDELLDEATRVAREYQHISVTLLQRRLKVGYARGARLMDQLEARGIVGAADGTKQRPVILEQGTLTEDKIAT